MTNKTRQEIVSVVEYLNTGVKSNGVTRKSLRDYFNHLVHQSEELPLHYQLRIDDILRAKKEQLLDYLAQTLGGTVFYSYKNTIQVRGLESLVFHKENEALIKTFQNELKIKYLVDNNFSLHPILIDTDINLEGVRIEGAIFVSTEFQGKTLGFVGPIDANYDLIVGIFKYLNLKY